jgi:hypothetical protein
MTTPIGAADGGNNGQGNDSGINPAWNDMLGVVPEELHSKVIPHLRNWDTNFQSKVNSVQSEFEPFKEFKEAGISPDQLRMGMGLMTALEQNPQQVYDLLKQQFNFDSDPGQGGGTNNDPAEDPYGDLPPAVREKLDNFESVQKQLDTITQWAVSQQSQSAEQQEDAALENLMTGLRTKHGDFDEHYVLSKMQAGQDPEDAIKDYNSFVERITTEAQRPKAPKILGSGSVVPGEQALDPKKMNPKETKDLVVQYLMNNQAQNR